MHNGQDIITRLEMLNSATAHEAIEEIKALRAALRPFAAKLHVTRHQGTGWVGIAVSADDVVTAHEVYNRHKAVDARR